MLGTHFQPRPGRRLLFDFMSTSLALQDAPPITRNDVVNEVSHVMDEAKGFDSGVSIDSWQHYIVTSNGAPDQVAIKVFEKIVFRHRGIKLKDPFSPVL